MRSPLLNKKALAGDCQTFQIKTAWQLARLNLVLRGLAIIKKDRKKTVICRKKATDAIK